VPAADRDTTPASSPGTATSPGSAAAPQDLPELRKAALDVLLAPELSGIVDLVAWRDGDDLHVADSEGHATLDRRAPDAPARLVSGRDPVAQQDPLVDDAFPMAGRRLASLFDDPRAPDLAVVHTGAHFWPERGGTPGEHGSLNAAQSRAPLLLSGPGVAIAGVVEGTARVVDVGPTLAHLGGADVGALEGLDGRVLTELVQPQARYVVGLLWDGAPSDDLLRLAADGTLPAVGRLLARGGALRGGAVAEFPSVTLVNHTSALTGLGPGRHGVVNNSFYDRARGEQLVPNDATTWHRAMEWVRPGVLTLFDHVAAARPGVRTACIDEPVDGGAWYSTFGMVRAAGRSDGSKSLREQLPDPTGDEHATQEQVVADDGYAWGTQVDAMGLTQVMGLLSDPDSFPDLLWWNFTLTDSGHHLGGPGSAQALASLVDSDRRLAVFLDRLDELGRFEDTVFLLTADHGSQLSDPDCRGDWDEALRAAGVPFRDEAYGFLYLGVS
jgi:phosphonoacetate hydrolase